MANENAPRDQNQVPTMLAVDDTTGEVRQVACDTDGNLLVVLAGVGSGTVTDVSVVSANGFAGTVATSTTTPAITLSTTINSPVLAGNGTAISAATTTGSGNTVVLQGSPTLTTPVIGAATGTSLSVSGLLASATGLTLEETGAGTDIITLQAPASIAASYTLTLPVDDGSASQFLQTDGAGVLAWATPAGSGDVVGPASATDGAPALFDGATGKLLKNSTPTGTGNPVLQTTPTLTTPVLGVATATSINKVALTAPATSATLTIADGKTLTVSDTMTLAGPNGSGNVVFTTSPTLVTPVLGVAAATSINKVAITAPATSATLTIADGKTLTVNNSITLSGTDATTITFPTTSATIARTDAAQTFTGIQTITNITLPDQGQIKLTVPTTDLKATGPTCGDFNSGYSSSAIGDLVYLDSSSTWQKTDANTLALYNGLLGIALEVKASGAALLVALPGSFVYSTTGFPTWTIGSPIYMSETAGAMTHTAPTTTDSATRVVGWGVHADKMYFFPSPDYITHT